MVAEVLAWDEGFFLPDQVLLNNFINVFMFFGGQVDKTIKVDVTLIRYLACR